MKSKAKHTLQNSKLSLDKKPRPSAGVISRTNPDGSVAIMALDNERYYFTISDLAAEVWKKLDGKRTLRQILNYFIKKHGLPQNRF